MTVCFYLFATLLTASCPEGNALGFSITLSTRTRPPTATATAVRCRASPAASAVDPTEEVDGATEGDVEYHDEEQSGEDDFDDDDIHPSVAWLYPAGASPATERTGSGSNGRERKRRRPSRRTLCVDYGTRRVGLAIGVGISPRTVPGVTNRGSDLEVARQVLVRARGEGIRDIVVGLPLERQAYQLINEPEVLQLPAYFLLSRASSPLRLGLSLKSCGVSVRLHMKYVCTYLYT